MNFIKLLKEQITLPEVGDSLKLKKEYTTKKLIDLYSTKKLEPITLAKGTNMVVLDIEGNSIEMKPDKQNVVAIITTTEFKELF